ncbi:hypothetical protein NHX12_012284 [Muraenolepis orangiensis]|uniref:PKD domain-containing protein n=1 Tax=Muraenolepis orangiensis TaxID=630683 RepID=A0A9Q0DCI6_9TELE|nr:hypothetical protein NHX12_012284 [Muraenolepis orangiensis]
MYPIWKDEDPRYKHSWKGGRVTFNVGNDAPTLTGAKVTFTIDLEFPHGQKVQPNGEVVWSEDCIVNGTEYYASKPVYPPDNTESEGVFPDGVSFKKDKNPSYVFVWKTWGQYWQVSDGPSSSLTVDTDGVPLGSYSMDIVIYHYRSKEKFIPMGYASTQFSITDQIPFAVSLDQVKDVVAGDLRFVQNRAVAFTVALHDPSSYLSDADTTFNWDFGDQSGALISRELTVTHTYVKSGSYKPRVVVQAVIPDKACDPPVVPTQSPQPPTDLGTTVRAGVLGSAVPVRGSHEAAVLNVNMTLSDTAAEEEEASPSPPAAQEAPSHASPDLPPALLAGSATGRPNAVSRDAARKAPTSPVARVGKTLTGHQAIVAVVAKRDAGDEPSDDGDCVIYRYGSFCTAIQVMEGIEKVEIMQMDNALMQTTENHALDLRVTCQGSLPKEVCSVILDAECLRPIHSECNTVEPSGACQMVLHHFFNHSGVFCINVSVANDVSLAVASAKVSVHMVSGLSSSGSIAIVLGVLAVALTVGTVAFSYKRFKAYRPLKEDFLQTEPQCSQTTAGSGSTMFRNLPNRQGAVDNCPLLPERLV